MFKRSTFLVALVAALLAPLAPALAENPNIPDNGYLEALKTADQFAYAWSTRDAKLGGNTLAPDLKRKMAADDISSFFSGTSTPENFSFLLGHQRLVSPGLYRFDVKLFRYMPNAQGLVQSEKALTLDVEQVEDVWFVKALPY